MPASGSARASPTIALPVSTVPLPVAGARMVAASSSRAGSRDAIDTRDATHLPASRPPSSEFEEGCEGFVIAVGPDHCEIHPGGLKEFFGKHFPLGGRDRLDFRHHFLGRPDFAVGQFLTSDP